MNKTKIDWADMTWNPVTGCLHDCEYCYARKIAKRFCTNEFGKDDGLLAPCNGDCKACSDMDGIEFIQENKRWNHSPSATYPFGFMPTFHPHRLDEPAKKKAGQNIFVCSMADLFGKWVPEEWIQNVFKVCEENERHRYLFLSKNPARYGELNDGEGVPDKANFWYGSTVVHHGDKMAYNKNRKANCNFFLSVEPLMENPFPCDNIGLMDWIIVGAETGNRKEKVTPKRSWIRHIARVCDSFGIPLFMKDSVRELMGEEFRQEFPW